MRTMLIATAAAALCAAALPAAAQNSSDQAARPSQQERARSGSAAERKICITERVSESRISRRICRTAQQWRDSNDTEIER